MDDYGRIAGWMALASGEAEGSLEAASRMAVADARAGGDERVIKAPGQLGSTISDPAAIRAAMEALGFEWLEEPSTDPRQLLTQYVRLRLPEGWTLRRGSDHRQQYIHDPRGVRRVSLYDVGQFWDPYCATTLLDLGYDISTTLCYGEQVSAEDVHWDALSADEREQVRQSLADLVAKGQDSRAYAETGKRAAAWLERLGEPAA